MNLFAKWSIRTKVAFALWSAVTAALIIAVIGLLAFERLTLEGRARRFMEPYAQLISVGAETAVAFRDSDRAEEILQTLRANPGITQADIILENGGVLASYRRYSNDAVQPPARTPGIYLQQDTAELVQSLSEGSRLRLVMSLEQLREQTRQYLWVLLLVILMLLAITVGLMMQLQRTIIDPISALVQAAERVRAGPGYQGGVPAAGSDEIARLGRSFNAMLDAVQQRENDLREISLLQRTILDNAACGIISTQPDGVVTSFNPAAERLLDYKAAEVVGIKTPLIWHDPDELAQRAKEFTQATGEIIEPGFAVFATRFSRNQPDEAEWTFIRKDGKRVPVALSGTVLRNENGEITGYVALAYDLTLQKRSEQALRKLNEELEQRVNERTSALQSKSDELQDSQRALMNIIEDLNEKSSALETANKEMESFSYSVSHDLRAPLRSIDGFSRALLEDYGEKLDDQARENLDAVRKASQRMGQLIDDMLRLSKLNRGEMRWTEVNLSEMAEQIIADLHKTDPGRIVESVIAPRCFADGDAALLKIAMENILGNAWKYTGRKPSARIEFGSMETAEGRTFFVRDNGCGFDTRYVHKLFGAFQRLHTLQEYPGTGVGLASVQRVIRRHGGKVWIEGKVDCGTSLYFTLPARV